MKISYTVELEEIPECINQLVKECTSAVVASTSQIEKAFNDNLIKNGNVQAALEDLVALRQVLFKADQQLSEYSSLLNNLQQAYVTTNEEIADDPE